ncbi:MAG: SRPBCC family protein [Gammaproteobacteria bacterium]
MKLILCVALVWINACCILHAEEITAEYKQGVYHLNASFIVEASAEKVVAALTDYENISQLHPTIIESEILETTSSKITARIRTVVKDCAIFFCKKITRVENITQRGFASLDAEVVPFLSDLRSGHTSWKFVSVDNHTEVTYLATMQPKFWIPPLIRSHTVTNKFKKRISEIVQRLQVLAPSYPLK